MKQNYIASILDLMQNHFGRDKAGTSIMLVERNALDFNEVNNAALILPWLI